MSAPGLASPNALITELQFPKSAPPLHADVSEDRFRTLASQAYVLEFAANSVLASYSPPDVGADLWIASLAPKLVQYHQGLVPEREVAVAETRTMMAQEFMSRVDGGEVSATDHTRILEGLLAFEDPAIARVAAEMVATFEATHDPSKIRDHISSGNNAAAFIIKNVAGIDGDAVLKIGLPILHERNYCDLSAFTNLRRWLGLMASKGVEGFEQPVAFSAEAPVSITKFVPGIELYEISKLANKPQPSEEAQLRFANALYESIVRRITIDINGRDILYEPDTDVLTIIDHAASSRAYHYIAVSYEETVDAIVAVFRASFGYEFDDVAFGRLLSEFSRQGLYDLRSQN